jgi:hypothetical protein
MRVRRVRSDEERGDVITLGQWIRGIPRRLYGFTKSEWVPGVCQDEIKTVSYPEGKTYVVWTWLLSTSTVIHIIFGSLLLSGLLFIGPRDALLVIFRYVASVLVCRIIVMFELAGMREHYIPNPDEHGQVQVIKVDTRVPRFGKSSPEDSV